MKFDVRRWQAKAAWKQCVDERSRHLTTDLRILTTRIDARILTRERCISAFTHRLWFKFSIPKSLLGHASRGWQKYDSYSFGGGGDVDTRCASFYFDLPEMQSVYTYEYVYSCTSTVRVLRCTVRCSCTTCTHIHTKVDILPSKIQNTSGSTCTRTRTVQ